MYLRVLGIAWICLSLSTSATPYVEPRITVRGDWADSLLAAKASAAAYDAWRAQTVRQLSLDDLELSGWQTAGWYDRNAPGDFSNSAWDPGVEKTFLASGQLQNGQTVAGRDFRPLSWADGTVLANHERVRNRKAVDYYHRTITSPDARRAILHLGFTHSLTVWLNGSRLLQETVAPRPCKPNQAALQLALRKGQNHLLIKAADGYRQAHGAALYASLLPNPARFHGRELQLQLFQHFPIACDWTLQDGFDYETWLTEESGGHVIAQAVSGAVQELGPRAAPLAARLASLREKGGSDQAWLALYTDAAMARRRLRLERLYREAPEIVFIKRRPVSPSFFAYTEGQSDAQHERHFSPGSSLCLLTASPEGDAVRTMLASPNGAIRDVDVSHDGTRLLFAWKTSDREDDYHLYELAVATGTHRQLSFGLGFADYEGIYLPNGDLLFSSTRCVQTVDCWWTEVSNLYTCDGDGRYLRRLGFDQVHTICPHVLDDGTVIYTRWDYNDRGQVFPQGLFRMNPDGTGQTEFYGNNSYFPTTTSHARGMPGSRKVVAVAMGHHTWQAGKLIEIDPGRGRQEASGVQFLAPRRPAEAVRIDAYGQSGELFRHPYPLGDGEFLTAYVPAQLNRGRSSVFGLYFMCEDGRRELLAYDPGISANHPIPLRPRTIPHPRPSVVDYRESTGTYYVQDVYSGPGLQGIPRGVAKTLRVIALEFRAAGIQNNSNRGPAGGALVSTPISVPNGAWDVKRVVGDAVVYPDGSAFFQAPARTPVYFQVLDERGFAVQTMRSWSTLQPGEAFSCTGCHEHKNETPDTAHRLSQAMRAGPQELRPFDEEPHGFSFPKDIQPILDAHCIRCHSPEKAAAGGVKPEASHCWRGDAVAAICDGRLPSNSDDHSIPRHTWWSRKGGEEWVQLSFGTPRRLSVCDVYWFDDRPRNGGCRVPASWTLMYRAGDKWLEVPKPSAYGVAQDRLNTVHFDAVTSDALRIVAKMQPNYSGGVLEMRCGATLEEARKPVARVLDLTGRTSPGSGGRRWSKAYLSLTGNGQGSDLVNWISAQSIPSMLPPYHKGAATSRLFTILSEGHKGVVLPASEFARLACWVDLLVPYCGDYTEANSWTDEEKAKYMRYLNKRRRMAALERRNIEQLVLAETGREFRLMEGYRNVALNPLARRGEPVSFPHASSNSECRNEECFAAVNAIDGNRQNLGHGPGFPSWGPERRDDAWLRIEFGHPVEVDRVDLYIRADFPHDRHWRQGVLAFSDGTRQTITIRRTDAAQRVTFAPRQITWVMLTELEQDDPPGWCAVSEIEVYGRDLALPGDVSAPLRTGKP